MVTFVGIYSSSMLTGHEIDHGPVWEIMYCLEGSGTLVTEQKSICFSAGDITILPPHIRHRFSPDSSCRHLYVMADDSCPFFEPTLLGDTSDSDIYSLLMMLYRIHIKYPSGKSAISTHMLSALIEFLRLLCGTAHRTKVVEAMENDIIQNMSNSEFRMNEMYSRLYISEEKARTQFRAEIGCLPHEYLSRLRIQQACRIFAHSGGETSVSEVAERVGVPDAQYFSRMFKKHTGLSPSAWIQKNVKE